MRIITRKEWGARPPRSVEFTSWAKRTGFMIHYSAASADQTPRAIQNYHMDTRGWSDVGYNFLVHSVTGTLYEGRGWLVIGAHCQFFNTPNIGVCVIGKDNPGVQDVSDAARTSLRWLYADAQRRKGASLRLIGHRDRGATQCPGDELYAWLRAGMPGGTVPPPAPKPPAPGPTPGADWEEEARMALDTIRCGGRGPDVRKSQALLAAAGFPPANTFDRHGRPDGIAGNGWRNSVRSFQATRKLKVDGVCGPATWKELLA